jgi:hypothetical protein
MNLETIISFRAARRIAKLWGVQPYRVDVEVDLANQKMRATLDEKAPDPEKLAILERNSREMARKSN